MVTKEVENRMCACGSGRSTRRFWDWVGLLSTQTQQHRHLKCADLTGQKKIQT